MLCVTTEDPTCVCGLAGLFMSVTCAATVGCVDGCGWNCHLGPCIGPWQLLTLVAMLMSVVHAATEGYVRVCSPAAMGDCVDALTMLPLKNMKMSVICSAAGSLIDVHKPQAREGDMWMPVVCPVTEDHVEVYGSAAVRVGVHSLCCHRQQCGSQKYGMLTCCLVWVFGQGCH